MNSQLWVEKYRPLNIASIKSQDDIIDSFKNIIKTKNMPHLLFFGPSGCGKTSTILALARDLFGKAFKERVIELNASDERGIKVVRDKIKIYAKSAINVKENIPNWKIIILDEADSMTSDSQFALRKIMEDYSSITRFCIICNYHHKIIDPIISRCSLYRFRPIKKTEQNKIINSICLKENIKISRETRQLITTISRGDLRKCINLVQKCKNLFFKNIEKKYIYEILGIIELSELISLVNLAIDKREKSVLKKLNHYLKESYSLINQITFIIDIILNNEKLNDKQKSKILILLSDIDQLLLVGCNEHILFYKLFYYIMSI